MLVSRKKHLINSHIVRQFELEEALINHPNLTEKSSFQEIRKLLIQYFPHVKDINVF